MARTIRVAAAQMGATHRADERAKTLNRMLKLLEESASSGAEIILFPETAFTTFFPRYLIDDPDELASWFEHGNVTTSPTAAPLFRKARDLNVDISVGFAEAADNGERFNSCIYYHAKTGTILSKYRKIHLPGDFEPFPDPEAINQLEKRYFKPGDLGFQAFRIPDLAGGTEPIAGMMICNDRRWPEAWRCYGLQGVELILCGYNTAGFAPHLWGAEKDQDPQKAEETALFHHKLVMQANSYMNATFSVCAARAGMDDGKYSLIGGSCIIGPEGNILAEAKTKEDEVVLADCNLDLCIQGKTRTFDFARHRRVEHYKRIVEQTGVIEPAHLSKTKMNGENPLHIDDTEANNDLSNETNVLLGRRVSAAAPKKIRILLCNPNATSSMTDNCVKSVESTLPSDVEVTGFTTPPPAPSAIESQFDNICSGAAAARALLPLQQREGYDAILVACFSDHSLIRILREEFTVPVIGIMEASLFAARTLGGRFGIICTSNRTKLMLANTVRHYGMESDCAGIESCNLGVLGLKHQPRDQVLGIMREAANTLRDKGAEVLTLGCAGMTDMKVAVDEAVGEGGRVVDGVAAGVHHLIGLVRQGAKTAKSGVYTSSAETRKLRGQAYV